MQIEYSKRANAELQKFVIYGENNFGKHVALEHYNRLRAKIKQLLVFPELGFPEPLLADKKKEYRTLVFEKRYKVIYTVDYSNERIVIDDFWDLRRNPTLLVKRLK